MDTFEGRKKKVLGPIFLEAGAALFDCQGFEFGIGYLLYLLSRVGAVGLDPSRCAAILDDEEKKTAGQLLGLLKSHVRVSSATEKGLVEALQSRNNLIHRYLIDNAERLVDVREHEKIVKEIRSLRAKVRKIQKELEPLVAGLAKLLDGLDMEEMHNETKRQFLRDTMEH